MKSWSFDVSIVPVELSGFPSELSTTASPILRRKERCSDLSSGFHIVIRVGYTLIALALFGCGSGAAPQSDLQPSTSAAESFRPATTPTRSQRNRFPIVVSSLLIVLRPYVVKLSGSRFDVRIDIISGDGNEVPHQVSLRSREEVLHPRQGRSSQPDAFFFEPNAFVAMLDRAQLELMIGATSYGFRPPDHVAMRRFVQCCRHGQLAGGRLCAPHRSSLVPNALRPSRSNTAEPQFFFDGYSEVMASGQSGTVLTIQLPDGWLKVAGRTDQLRFIAAYRRGVPPRSLAFNSRAGGHVLRPVDATDLLYDFEGDYRAVLRHVRSPNAEIKIDESRQPLEDPHRHALDGFLSSCLIDTLQEATAN